MPMQDAYQLRPVPAELAQNSIWAKHDWAGRAALEIALQGTDLDLPRVIVQHLDQAVRLHDGYLEALLEADKRGNSVLLYATYNWADQQILQWLLALLERLQNVRPLCVRCAKRRQEVEAVLDRQEFEPLVSSSTFGGPLRASILPLSPPNHRQISRLLSIEHGAVKDDSAQRDQPTNKRLRDLLHALRLVALPGNGASNAQDLSAGNNAVALPDAIKLKYWIRIHD